MALLAARFLPGKLFWPIGLLFGGNVSTIINLFLAGLALWMGRWEVAIFMVAAAFGIASFIQPPMWLWAITRSDRINPKYGIAKRMFGTSFPFEADLR